MKIWSFAAYDVVLEPGIARLVPAMSAISDEIEFAKPKPPAKKLNIGKHVSLHGAYQVMVDNLLGEFVIEPVSG
jgi:hypothetical protein